MPTVIICLSRAHAIAPAGALRPPFHSVRPTCSVMLQAQPEPGPYVHLLLARSNRVLGFVSIHQPVEDVRR